MVNLKKKIRKIRARSIPNFISDRRAVSVALTTLIISAAVIAAGISVLYWAYSWGTIANQQYTQTINSNQNATSEMLTFEYVTYSAPKLSVYLINCGHVDDVGIARVYIWSNSSQAATYIPDDPGLRFTTNSSQIQSDSLDVGNEGYFTVTTSTPLSSGYYCIRIVTERGRNFDTTLSVS